MRARRWPPSRRPRRPPPVGKVNASVGELAMATWTRPSTARASTIAPSTVMRCWIGGRGGDVDDDDLRVERRAVRARFAGEDDQRVADEHRAEDVHDAEVDRRGAPRRDRVDHVQPAVADDEQASAIGLDEVGLVDALLLGVGLRAARAAAPSAASRPIRRSERRRRASPRAPTAADVTLEEDRAARCPAGRTGRRALDPPT